ncbi:MAG: hypothetical protein V4671_04670 [Armatimonadota bacterium]
MARTARTSTKKVTSVTSAASVGSVAADVPEIQSAPEPPAARPTLADILEAVPPSEYPLVEVDITPFFKSGGEKQILTWQMPTTPKIYVISEDAGKLYRSHSHWTRQLSLDVATLAACHVAPDPGDLSPSAFYAALCEASHDLWAFLLGELQKAFPALRNKDE